MGDRRGWVFLEPEAVPERWRSRAVEVLLVPLLPEEMDDILAQGRAVPELDPKDERLAELVASGASLPSIADELGLAPRTVERRVARLRTRFGVGSTAELAALFSARGF